MNLTHPFLSIHPIPKHPHLFLSIRAHPCPWENAVGAAASGDGTFLGQGSLSQDMGQGMLLNGFRCVDRDIEVGEIEG